MLVFLKAKESPNFLFILFIIIMFFFCLYLYFNNKKLKQRISKLEQETKEILERKIVKESKSDLVSIKTLSLKEEPKEKKQKETINETPKKNTKPNYSYKYKQTPNHEKTDIKPKESRPTNNIIEKTAPIKKETKPQPEKPRLKANQTKPIKLENVNNLDFNINEFIPKDDKAGQKAKPTTDYLEEISAQLANELNPQTIELTEYEKVQEEQAVISYQELLALKDKGELQAEEDENINFIEDLKHFRNNLN